MPEEHFIVIGNGPAGNQAALTIKKQAPDVRVTLVSRESGGCYRPDLLPDFIAGKISENDLYASHPRLYAERGIKLRHQQKVVAIDPHKRRVFLDHKEVLSFDGLIIAVGGRPRIPEPFLPFRGLMLTLKTLEDARTWAKCLARVDRVLIIGGDLTSLGLTKALLRVGKDVVFMLNEEALWPLGFTGALFQEVAERLIAKGVKALRFTKFRGMTRLTDRRIEVRLEEEAIQTELIGAFFGLVPDISFLARSGFALMTELITHGVMAEIPAVVIDAQRGGPATGLSTKTEQSDLHAAVFGGPGDSPRIVMAPTNVSECHAFTIKSFQLAERYQTPVILLTDFFLHNRVESVLEPRATGRELADGNLYPGKGAEGSYKRYELTESGISPRSIPGMEGFVFTATGLEHSEAGVPCYDPENHMRLSAKRHRKIQGALKDLPPPVEYPNRKRVLDVGVISWGSTFGAALEAVLQARERSLEVGALKMTSLYPFHEGRTRDFMARCRKVLIPELNYQGQLADLIGHLFHGEVMRLNFATGAPIAASLILKKIEELL